MGVKPNVALVCPAGIVTLAGTVSTLGVSLIKVTVNALPKLALRVTVPVTALAPALSLTLEALKLRDKVVGSFSKMVMGALAEPRPAAVAVTVSDTGLPAMKLSMGRPGNSPRFARPEWSRWPAQTGLCRSPSRVGP